MANRSTRLSKLRTFENIFTGVKRTTLSILKNKLPTVMWSNQSSSNTFTLPHKQGKTCMLKTSLNRLRTTTEMG